MKLANAYCSMRVRALVGEAFSRVTASRSPGGTTSQPSRSAGASVLLADPA